MAVATCLPLPLCKIASERSVRQRDKGEDTGIYHRKPDDHYNSIRNKLGLKNGTLAYHLRVLEKNELVRMRRVGLNKRFYPYQMKVPTEEELKMQLLNPTQQRVRDEIEINPGVTQNKLMKITGLSQQTLSFNLKGLIEKNVIRSTKEEKENRYYLNPYGAAPLEPFKACPHCNKVFKAKERPQFCPYCAKEL
jgi:predicted transcriptional regulator